MSLVCTIEMDKTKGITVQIDNADSKITQTITVDGTSLTLKVTDQTNTSTWVQKADSIVVTCKDFTLDTETITFKSSKASSWTSQDKLDVKSTSDMTLDSSAKLTASATSDAKLSSQTNFDVEATNGLTLKGLTAAMSASGGAASVKGLQLALEGQTQAEMKSPMATINASGQLDLQATGIANLKGAMTNVGGMVKLGG